MRRPAERETCQVDPNEEHNYKGLKLAKLLGQLGASLNRFLNILLAPQGRTAGDLRWCGACSKAHPGARNLKVRGCPAAAYDAFGVFRTSLPQKIGVFRSSSRTEIQ